MTKLNCYQELPCWLPFPRVTHERLQILALRAEKAKLLGFDNHSEFSMASKVRLRELRVACVRACACVDACTQWLSGYDVARGWDDGGDVFEHRDRSLQFPVSAAALNAGLCGEGLRGSGGPSTRVNMRECMDYVDIEVAS